MEKYSSYKDSGVKWLGEIPSHWEVISLKHLANISSGSTPSSSVEKYWNGNVRWITPADFKTETKYVSCGIRNITEEGVSACSTVVLPQNSVVFSKRAPVGQVSITTEELCVNQGCIACVPNSKVISTFLYYLLSVYRNEFDFFSVGTTFREISLKEFSSFKVSVPSILEQELIVKYLDSATSQIDTAIEQQKKMIELLNERKQIIINNAVTKGLDPNVKMKDSGVDWIGEIPEGWEVRKLKHFAKTNSGSTPRSISGKDNPQSTIKWVRTTDLKNSHITDTSEYLSINEMKSASCPLLPKGTVLISMYGGEGSFGKLGLLDTEATINQALCSINCTDKIIPEFIFFYLQAIHPIWIKYAMSTRKDPNLNQQTIKNIDVVFPAIDEQMYIVSAINKSIIQIDRALDNFNDQISLLQERKQIIINEVVTGKVKVS